MGEFINEPDRLKEFWNLYNEVKKNPNNTSLDKLKVEFEYFLKSNESLKEYIIKYSENISDDYMSYPVILRKISKVRNFTLMRYQDGEWTCMLKIEPHFKNKIPKYGKEIGFLGNILLDIIKEKPKYYISVNAGTFHERAGLVWDYLKDIKNLFVGEIFRGVSVTKGLDDFIGVLKNRRVILVGPDWLTKLEGFDREHIITPFGTLFKEETIKRLNKEVGDVIEKYKKENPVILYSCSFPAKIMGHKFYKQYGETITQIDVGAICDPYCGKPTRPYHKKVIDRINLNK